MSEVSLLRQLRREQAVIQAMHQRPWWRISILWRRPWKKEMPWRLMKKYTPELWPIIIWNWLTIVHDCKDPEIGCSCSGGFRFPLEFE